jgi:molybdopterin molybdotransferase
MVRDDPSALRRAITRGLRESDIVLAAGGASVGDYDFVRPVAEEIGIVEHFRAVAVKPGKPVYFGTWGPAGGASKRKLLFGVPGNPVSALVALHEFVRPALRKTMGHPAPADLELWAEITVECTKKPGRLRLLRGRLETKNGRLLVHPRSRQGSHMMGGMASADCLICFPREEKRLAKGRLVQVKMISW